jgi:hypothetical protein
MPVHIGFARWNVAHIAVLVERLRVSQVRIRNRFGRGRPVRRDEPTKPTRIMPRPKVIQPRFGVPFFAGEFVMIIQVPASSDQRRSLG